MDDKIRQILSDTMAEYGMYLFGVGYMGRDKEAILDDAMKKIAAVVNKQK